MTPPADGAEISRRALLRGAVAAGVVAVVGACAGDGEPSASGPSTSSATTATTAPGATPTLAPTPACDDGDDPTPAQTEGPYFTPNSPERASLLDGAGSGTRLVVSGQVLDTACQPVRRALLDFWQADGGGEYDNQGYRLRGHLFSDADGRYRLETIVPGLYPGRTRHIHVKVQAPGGPVLTTQLYFPGEAGNARDGIFRQELVMQVAQEGQAQAGRFDFVVRT